MSNVRFLYEFKFDDATITSSNEVSGLPDDNAVDDFVAKKWRIENKELITNGDMETDSNWDSINDPEICEQSNEHAHSGTYSWKTGTNQFDGVGQNISGLVVGRTYRITVWMYISSLVSGSVRIQFDNTKMSNQSTVGSWFKAETTHVYTGTSDLLSFWVNSTDAITFYIDDVSVVEIVQWIKFDLGSPKRITMLTIFGHNLTSDAVVKLQAYSDDAWTVPPAWESEAMTWNAQALVLFPDQTYRWWRITIEDGDNPDGYIEIGRICAGEFYEPDVNVNQEMQKKLIDPSLYQESDGRQGYAIEKDVYRIYDVSFSGISREQQEEFEALFRTVKTIRPLVLALDPDDYPEEDTIYCHMTTPLAHALGALKYGDVSVSFEEKVT